MIYTLTLNPCIDYYVNIDTLVVNNLNISSKNTLKAGGKGINVSLMLNNLFCYNEAVLITGGAIGDLITNNLKSQNVNYYNLLISNNNRINLKIKDINNNITEIAGTSPEVKLSTYIEILQYLTKLNDNDIIVFSGSIPYGLPNNIYYLIANSINPNVKTILDTRDNLKNNIYNNFLLKPNLQEFENLCNTKFTSLYQIKDYANFYVNSYNITYMLISLGQYGAMLVSKDSAIFSNAPIGVLNNATGSGDSMVAGFIFAHLNNLSNEDALKFSVGCGSATAFNENIAKYEHIEQLLPQIKAVYL